MKGRSHRNPSLSFIFPRAITEDKGTARFSWVFPRGAKSRGFALIVSLSLMVLVTVLAIGLLTLSTVGLRATGHGEAMAVARANARLALALAIGELQKQAGPDPRITTTADQLAGAGDGDSTAAAEGRRHWTGVYDAWSSSAATRPEPRFRRWLVSGDPAKLSSLAEAKGDGSGTTELVGAGTLGAATDRRVVAPLVAGETSAGSQGRHAWWIGDQGVKAALAHSDLTEPADLAATRQALLSSPRHAIEWAATAGSKPFAGLTGNDERSAKVTGWQQAAFLADKPHAPRPLFHDLAASTSGLLTNVRAGGFRRDLSFHLEKPQSSAPQNALYTVNGQKGINEAELWLYYNAWKELKSGGNAAYTTGGSVGNQTPYLQLAGTLADLKADPENLFKQPTYINAQTALSFHAREVKNAAGQTVKRLALVVDPIVTMWNPLDVPVVVTPAYNSVKFWQLPYDLKITRPSGATTVSLKKALGDNQHHYLTLVVGKVEPVTLRPGEVVMFSQGPNTPLKEYKPYLNFIDAEAGWNFGGGIAIDLKDSSGKFIESAGDETIRYEVTPNNEQSGGSTVWFLTGNVFYYKEDRDTRGESLGVGHVVIDSKDGQPSERVTAAQKPEFFSKIKPADTRPLSFAQLAGRKEPFMLFSFNAKTEQGADRSGRFLSRFNPKAHYADLQTLAADELETLPFEVHIEPLNSWKNRNFEVSTTGGGYFGGGWTRELGTGTVITHTIPREPVHSLAAFQHAFANGMAGSTKGLFGNKPLLPQISHAIGNSTAPSVIAADKTSSSLGGPRALADHSYLANRALWDDWFLSGIAPQTAPAFSNKRAQKQVASDFLNGEQLLANSRYRPALAGRQPDEVLKQLFSGDSPSATAAQKIAALLSVDGMFNVNSTSVEAWKTLLGGLKQRPVSVRGAAGADVSKDSVDVPVVSLFGPDDKLASGENADDILDPAQWCGRRELTEDEIDALAEAIVREVRKRGPFLSLADFVNRRPGKDKSLARAGTIQSALDSKDVPINAAYNRGSRAANPAGPGRAFAFPEAEQGPAAYGIPGVVKQADILTPIAPYLSARSDTFLIRTYGDCLDDQGKVLARAWCEAEVQRGAAFIDPADEPTKLTAALEPINQTFGRRFNVVSFRWLHADEV